jgi:hypothetical protein
LAKSVEVFGDLHADRLRKQVDFGPFVIGEKEGVLRDFEFKSAWGPQSGLMVRTKASAIPLDCGLVTGVVNGSSNRPNYSIITCDRARFP